MWGCGLPSPFCMFFIVKGQKTVSIESALKVLACRWQHCKVLEVLNSEVFACSAFPQRLTAHTLHPAPAPSSSPSRKARGCSSRAPSQLTWMRNDPKRYSPHNSHQRPSFRRSRSSCTGLPSRPRGSRPGLPTLSFLGLAAPGPAP